MSSSTIIELRELDLRGDKKNANLPNGQFEVQLRKPLIIEKGSSIGIKSGFIDSVDANSGKIHIPENNIYTVNYCIGFQHYSRDGKMYGGNIADGSAGSYPPIDNKMYFPSNIKGTKDPAHNHVYINRIEFYKASVSFHSRFGKNYPIIISYVDEYGITKKVNKIIPDADSNKQDETNVDMGNLVARENTVKIDSPSWSEIEKGAHVRSYDIITSPYTPPSGSGVEVEPKSFTMSFSLQAGDYEPTHLCELLTEKFTNNIPTTGDISKALNSNFLKTTTEINTVIQSDDSTLPTDGAYYMAEDGSAIIQYPLVDKSTPIYNFTSNAKVIGTDQVAFVYDPDLDKITISQSHANLYSQGTSTSGIEQFDGNPMVKIFPKTADPTVSPSVYTDGIWASRNGSVIFQSMEPLDFWFGTLGLDPEICINPNVNLSKHSINGDMFNLGKMTTYAFGDLQNGKHLTDSFINTSMAVQKNSQYNNLIGFHDLEAITNANVKIYAKNSLNNKNTQSGYYLVSIEGYGSNLIGEYELNTTVKEIVGRYFQNESYTQFQGISAPYIHNSDEPLIISNLKVKILAPDFDVATIQNDNTIFLEIIRPQNNFLTEN